MAAGATKLVLSVVEGNLPPFGAQDRVAKTKWVDSSLAAFGGSLRMTGRMAKCQSNVSGF